MVMDHTQRKNIWRYLVPACCCVVFALTFGIIPSVGAQTGLRVTGFQGVSAGQQLKGTANIQALVQGGNISQVQFTLSGPTSDTHLEKEAPYFFKGDYQGNPFGWDTRTVADGSYTLTAEATNSSGQKAKGAIAFVIANKTTAQPTATKTTAPTTAPTAAPTATPGTAQTATTVPSSGTGVCGESLTAWHPPVVNGCATGHEHGDAPPAWISAAGYRVSFQGGFNTSAAENTTKHAAMKGFTTRLNGIDIYFRIHAASNPLDRSARYHSYEVWARDGSGNVSHWQGWYNTGDPATDRIPRRIGVEILKRPIMLVVDQTSLDQGIRCEQWYAGAGEVLWNWDFGWTICNSTTVYQAGENATAADLSTWKIAPDNSKGLNRRLEAAWYSDRKHPTGTFYATQFGDIVSGPNDAICSASTTKFGVTYKNVCLEQYIAPTMTSVKYPDNATQKVFDGTGVQTPN